MQLEHTSDEALFEAYRSADDKAEAEQFVNELFRRHHLKVARWCLRFTSDRETAAELGQEICAKAYEKLSSFQNECKFSTWLYAIARNHCLNALRARGSAPETDSDEELLQSLPAPSSQDPYRAVQRVEAADLARQLINEALDDTEKQVFTLHFADELSLDAITRLLGLQNTSGAKAYMVSARRKLNRAVERWKSRSEQAQK